MKIFKNYLFIFLAATAMMVGCDSEDEITPTGNSITYVLAERSNSGVSGTAELIENSDNTITVNLDLSGTPDGGMHPAHIHFNSAAESGGIAISLGMVNGNTGESSVTFSTLDDGTPISYDELLTFDGYINVHLSESEIGTIVAQGDIGENVLTGEFVTYPLAERAVDGISGDITINERLNGEALAVISLTGTPDGGMHPAHIHMNTAVEGGGIAFTFNMVDGSTGMSMTNVDELDDGTAFGYADVLTYDGYVNVHLSESEIGTIVAQGDIGENALTGESITYPLAERAVDGISGDVTFNERLNGEALAVISLTGTPDGGMHPAHIHMNTAAESGGIAFTFNMVDGTTGMSMTNVDTLDDGTAFGYADVLTYDGYVNVHLSPTEIETIVAQGDIGQNALTGESTTYSLGEIALSGISGDVVFSERVNGEALAVISLTGTPDGGMHPAHIHMNDAATGGDIAFTFTMVDGSTGMSRTNVDALDDGTAFGYDDVLGYDGYVNVHLSLSAIQTIVAQGDIGSNAP